MGKNSRANLNGMRVAGFFSGIGGLELGFERGGFESSFLCEIDSDAKHVLEAKFPGTRIHSDIAKLTSLPRAEVLLAGFPCQDLSAVGTRLGLKGTQSSLVNKIFGLVECTNKRPDWIILENVPFMLQLGRGRAIRTITSKLVELGYSWAYRVIDSRAFGLPHRRRRVYLVATRGDECPAAVLFSADDKPKEPTRHGQDICRGFYWTEGNRGVGWAVDAIPTLKGGSGLSIPSPPAVWRPRDGAIFLPDIRDAERLQGFPKNWSIATERAENGAKRRRWRQVGNAVSVPVAHWIARQVAKPGIFEPDLSARLRNGEAWPVAAFSHDGKILKADVSEWPAAETPPHLHEFLKFPGHPITQRAADGFYQRVRRTTLHLEKGFLEALAVAAGHSQSSARRISPKRAKK